VSTCLPHLLRVAAVCFAALPSFAIAAPVEPLQYTPYCAGTIGVDYAWPAYSDSPDVNKFRDEIVFAMKSFYDFEYDEHTLPEENVQIGEPPRSMLLPQGWILAMDVISNTTVVAIPPKNGPFADELGLRALLERKQQIFGGGGSVTMPVRGTTNHGVRLPCDADNPANRAPAIILGIPFPG
jgi:hypothetical protein